MEEDFDMTMEEESGDHQWDSLSPSERKELLMNVFNDESWYDTQPFHDGGQAHPPFVEIAARVGTKTEHIKKYYIAWLRARGYDTDVIRTSMTTQTDVTMQVVSPPPSEAPQTSVAYQSEMDRMQSTAFTPPPQRMSMPAPTSADSTSNSVFAMMNFLGGQQQIAAESQHRQMMMQMEQRRLDQQRETELRREGQARDQQFMMQQMAFMKEMMRGKDNDGFFDKEMQGIMKSKMIDNLLDPPSSDAGALERIASRFLTPETMGAVASGASAALATRNQVPAGYDSPTYDPYAQPYSDPLPATTPVETQIPAQVQPTEPTSPMVDQGPQADTDNFFEGPEQAQPVVQQVEQQPAPTIIEQEPTDEEYQQALLEQFKQVMGAQLDDPKTLEAVQAQIEVSVAATKLQHSALAPQLKLDSMAKKMILVRSLRDIGRGMQDAIQRIESGTDETLVYSFIASELKKNPVFHDIFTNTTYEELMAEIEPFKDTGGVKWDYQHLLKPEVANVCRNILAAVNTQ